MVVSLDSVSQAIVDVMEMNDYAVDVTQDAETYHAVARRASCSCQRVLRCQARFGGVL